MAVPEKASRSLPRALQPASVGLVVEVAVRSAAVRLFDGADWATDDPADHQAQRGGSGEAASGCNLSDSIMFASVDCTGAAKRAGMGADAPTGRPRPSGPSATSQGERQGHRGEGTGNGLNGLAGAVVSEYFTPSLGGSVSSSSGRGGSGGGGEGSGTGGGGARSSQQLRGVRKTDKVCYKSDRRSLVSWRVPAFPHVVVIVLLWPFLTPLATMRAPSSVQVVEVAVVELRVLFEAAENPDPSPRARAPAAHLGVALDFAVSQCMHGQAQNIVYAWTTWQQVSAKRSGRQLRAVLHQTSFMFFILHPHHHLILLLFHLFLLLILIITMFCVRPLLTLPSLYSARLWSQHLKAREELDSAGNPLRMLSLNLFVFGTPPPDAPTSSSSSSSSSFSSSSTPSLAPSLASVPPRALGRPPYCAEGLGGSGSGGGGGDDVDAALDRAAVGPDCGTGPELSVSASLRPLRVSVTWDLIDFIRFFVDPAFSPGGGQPHHLEQQQQQQQQQRRQRQRQQQRTQEVDEQRNPPAASRASPPAAWLRAARVAAVGVKIDLDTRLVDLGAVQRGDMVELLKLFPLRFTEIFLSLYFFNESQIAPPCLLCMPPACIADSVGLGDCRAFFFFFFFFLPFILQPTNHKPAAAAWSSSCDPCPYLRRAARPRTSPALCSCPGSTTLPAPRLDPNAAHHVLCVRTSMYSI